MGHQLDGQTQLRWLKTRHEAEVDEADTHKAIKGIVTAAALGEACLGVGILANLIMLSFSTLSNLSNLLRDTGESGKVGC